MCSIFIINAVRPDSHNINSFWEFYTQDITHLSKITSHQVQDPEYPCSFPEDHQPS